MKRQVEDHTPKYDKFLTPVSKSFPRTMEFLGEEASGEEAVLNVYFKLAPQKFS